MLGIMAYWIDAKFQCQSVILSLKTICGPHTCIKLAICVQETLISFDLTSKLYCIKANNTSKKVTMGKALDSSTVPHFDVKKNLIGCMEHVINLVVNSRITCLDIKKNSVDPPHPSSLYGLGTGTTEGNISSLFPQFVVSSNVPIGLISSGCCF